MEDGCTWCSYKDVCKRESDDVIKEISSCEEKENIKLDEFLKGITFHLDNTKNSCKKYSEDHLYLEIYATKEDGQTVLHEVPLKVSDICE